MTVTPSPRLAAFLAALKEAKDNDLCSPPGITGLIKAMWVRRGLETGALAIHYSGKGLGLTSVNGTTLTSRARSWEVAQVMEDVGSPRVASRSVEIPSLGMPAGQMSLTPKEG